MTSGKSGVHSSATKIACQWLAPEPKKKGLQLALERNLRSRRLFS
jgi:hypothetical protein